MQVIKRNLPPVDPPSVVYERMNRIYREANLVGGAPSATGPTPRTPTRESAPPPKPAPKIDDAETIYKRLNAAYGPNRRREAACD
jgi:hypothetical protein